jgi:hypothetical protein
VCKKEDLFETNATEGVQGNFEKYRKKLPSRNFKHCSKISHKFLGPCLHQAVVENGCKWTLNAKESSKIKRRAKKCCPVPQDDSKEIETQVQDLIGSNLVEPFSVGAFPRHCSPTFLVDKKERQPRRIVGQYVKHYSMK